MEIVAVTRLRFSKTDLPPPLAVEDAFMATIEQFFLKNEWNTFFSTLIAYRDYA